MITVTILQKLRKYGKENLIRNYGKEVDDVRTEIFLENYESKTDVDQISCAKKLGVSMIPPCEGVLLNKIRRKSLNVID